LIKLLNIAKVDELYGQRHVYEFFLYQEVGTLNLSNFFAFFG